MTCCEGDRCKHGIVHTKIHLPPAKLDACQVCDVKPESTKDLKLCARCGERIYCGPACQKADWKTHKLQCGENDQIHLESFYPYLAFMANICHADPRACKPPHFALGNKIVNNVNPSAPPIKFPDGWEAKLVVVDDVSSPQVDRNNFDMRQWCPMAESEAVAVKLGKRIAYEGYVLPTLTAICLSILSEIYSTTSGKAGDGSPLPGRRTRFRYLSSPIVDFGIAKGTVPVQPRDRLAYCRRSTGEITRGQDPDEHYFTTIRGEDIELDFSMFTFNMTISIPMAPYIGRASEAISYVPAFFRERVFRRNGPVLHNSAQRFSALRNSDLQRAVFHSTSAIYQCDEEFVYKWLREVGGREATEAEKTMTCSSAMLLSTELGINLKVGTWKRYPKTPPSIGTSEDRPN